MPKKSEHRTDTMQISATVSTRLVADLDKEASRRSVTRARLIRELLEEGLSNRQETREQLEHSASELERLMEMKWEEVAETRLQPMVEEILYRRSAEWIQREVSEKVTYVFRELFLARSMDLAWTKFENEEVIENFHNIIGLYVLDLLSGVWPDSLKHYSRDTREVVREICNKEEE